MPTSALRRTAVTAAVLVYPVSWVVRAMRGLPEALGASQRQLRPTVAASPHYSDGKFHNTLPSPALSPANARDGLLRQWHDQRHNGHPRGAVPLVRPELPAQAGELAVTWFGHASALLEVDGARVLFDPVWGERVSPSPTLGPVRLHPAPGPVEELPPVDAVVISHDHYDHLDLPTVRALLRSQRAPFVVPLGIGVHLRSWGVPDDRIVELDWNGSATVGELTLTCTEAADAYRRRPHRDDGPGAASRRAGRRPGATGGGGLVDGGGRRVRPAGRDGRPVGRPHATGVTSPAGWPGVTRTASCGSRPRWTV